MSRRKNKGEAECQTVLQCTPHMVREGDCVKVLSDENTQTVVTCNPTHSNTNLCPLLMYVDPKEIEEGAVGFISFKIMKQKLHFSLPSDSNPDITSDSDSSDNSDVQYVSQTVITDEKILEEDIPTTSKVKPPSILKNRTQDNLDKTGVFSNYCQTYIMVSPHILKKNRKARVHSEISVQTSVTCHPSCSVSDIVPKLKAYLDHEGKILPVSGDSKANRSILDVIQGILKDVENSHKYMFDDNYELPSLPPEFINLDDVNKKESNLNSTEVPSSSYEINSELNENGSTATETETENPSIVTASTMSTNSLDELLGQLHVTKAPGVDSNVVFSSLDQQLAMYDNFSSIDTDDSYICENQDCGKNFEQFDVESTDTYETEEDNKNLFIMSSNDDLESIPDVLPTLIEDQLSNKNVSSKENLDLALPDYEINVSDISEELPEQQNEKQETFLPLDESVTKECICTGFKIKLLINNLNSSQNTNEVVDSAGNTGLELNILPGLQSLDVKPLPVNSIEQNSSNTSFTELEENIIQYEPKVESKKNPKYICDVCRDEPGTSAMHKDFIESPNTEQVTQENVETIVSKVNDGFQVINFKQSRTDVEQQTIISNNRTQSEIIISEHNEFEHLYVDSFFDNDDYFKPRKHPCYCNTVKRKPLCDCEKPTNVNKNLLPLQFRQPIENIESTEFEIKNEDMTGYAECPAEKIPINISTDEEYETSSDTEISNLSDNNDSNIIDLTQKKMNTKIKLPDNTFITLKFMLDLKNYETCSCTKGKQCKNAPTNEAAATQSNPIVPIESSYISGILPRKAPKLFNVINFEEDIESIASYDINSYMFSASARTINILPPSLYSDYSFVSTRFPVFEDAATQHTLPETNKENMSEMPATTSYAQSSIIHARRNIDHKIRTKISFRNTVEVDSEDEIKHYLKYSKGSSAFSFHNANVTATRKKLKKDAETFPTCTVDTCNILNEPSIQSIATRVIRSQNTTPYQVNKITPFNANNTVNTATSCSLLPSNKYQIPDTKLREVVSQSYVHKIPSQDHVVMTFKICEKEFKPVKMALMELKQKLVNLNMPEVNSMLNKSNETSNNSEFMKKSNGKSKIKVGVNNTYTYIPESCNSHTMKTRTKFKTTSSHTNSNLPLPQFPNYTEYYLDSLCTTPSKNSRFTNVSQHTSSCPTYRLPATYSNYEDNLPSYNTSTTTTSCSLPKTQEKGIQSQLMNLYNDESSTNSSCQNNYYQDMAESTCFFSEDAMSHVSSEEFINPCERPSSSCSKNTKLVKKHHPSCPRYKQSTKSSDVSLGKLLDEMKKVVDKKDMHNCKQKPKYGVSSNYNSQPKKFIANCPQRPQHKKNSTTECDAYCPTMMKHPKKNI